MNDISERIKKCVQMSKLNQTKFAARINLTPSQVSQMCAGLKKPSERTIKDICREFEISETWLKTGEGKPRIEYLPDDALTAALERIITAGPDNFRRRLISVLVKMPPEKWELLQEIAEDMAKAPEFTEPDAPRDDPPTIHGITRDEFMARWPEEAEQLRQKGESSTSVSGRSSTG